MYIYSQSVKNTNHFLRKDIETLIHALATYKPDYSNSLLNGANQYDQLQFIPKFSVRLMSKKILEKTDVMQLNLEVRDWCKNLIPSLILASINHI